MRVKYNKNVISYTKGASLADVIAFIEKRVKKREEEMSKRQWIVDQYNSYAAKNETDKGWLLWLRRQDPEKWNAPDVGGEK